MDFHFYRGDFPSRVGVIESRSSRFLKLISCLFLSVCYFVAVYSVLKGSYTNSDDASELILGKLLADEGGILSKNWYYSTELRVLNTNLIYSLFFRLTDNWHLVRVLSSAVLYGLLLCSYFLMCKAYGIGKYAWLFSAMLVLPISEDYYLFVINGLYYIPHIAITFTTLALLGFFLEQHGWRMYLIAAVSLFLSLLAGMGGARQLLILYLPMVIASVILFAIYNKEQKARRFLIGAVLSFCGSVIGFQINTNILFKEYTFQKWEVHFSPLKISRAEELINGLLNEYGFSTGDIFSFSLIRNTVAAVWMILTLYAMIRAIVNRKDQSFGHTAFSIFCATVFSVFILLYFFTDMRYEDRYWIPITVLSIPLLAGLVNSAHSRKSIVSGCAVFLILVCCFCAVDVYKADVYRKLPSKFQTAEQRQICQAAVNEGYSAGYASFWNANVLTELSNGQIDMHTMCDTGWDKSTQSLMAVQDVDQIFTWLQLKRHAAEHPEGKVFLLLSVSENEKNNWKQNLLESDIFYSSESYVAYGYESYEAMVNTLYQSYDVAFTNSENLLNGFDADNCRTLYAGGLSYGPYITCPSGEYEVTISGTDLNLAYIECCYNLGNNKIEIEITERTPTRIVYRFTLPEKTELIETTVKNQSEQPIAIHSIHIERK